MSDFTVEATEALTLALRIPRGYQGLSRTELLAVAQVNATLALVEQQKVANKLQVALVDQLTQIAPYLTPVGAVIDPSIRIRDYLTSDEWAGLDL